MPSLEELVGKAKAAPVRHVDVEIALDAGVGERIAALEAEARIVAADQRFSDPRGKKLEEQLQELRAEAAASLVTLRFTKLDPAKWAELTARSPMRPDSAIDLNYGYNYHEVCRQAAGESTSRVEGDTVTRVPAKTLEDLLAVVSGNDFERVMSAVFDVNVWSSSQDLAAAKKASLAASALASSSPSPSASRPAGSTGGSRRKSPTTSTTGTDSSER